MRNNSSVLVLIAIALSVNVSGSNNNINMPDPKLEMAVPDAPPPPPPPPPPPGITSAPTKSADSSSSMKKPQWKIDLELKEGKQKQEQQKIQKAFDAQPTKAKIEVGMIGRYESFKKVEDIINASGLRPNQILVVFDFDQTLTGRKYKDGDEIIDCSPINNAIINSLNDRGIAWGILSARTISPTTLQSIKNESDKFGIKSKLKSSLKEEKRDVFYKRITQPIYYGLLDHLAFARIGGVFAYEKDLALDYLIQNYKSEFDSGYPKLIIFVDDNAENILRMRDYFTTGNGRVHDTTVHGLVYDPAVRGEQGHQDALQALQPFMKK